MNEERPQPARPWYDAVLREIALRGWAKTELSERSGVARTTIDNWATNVRPPSARAVNAVADILGIDRADAHALAGITGPRTPEDIIPADVLALIRRHYRDPDQQREAIEQLAAIGPPASEPSAGQPRRSA